MPTYGEELSYLQRRNNALRQAIARIDRAIDEYMRVVNGSAPPPPPQQQQARWAPHVAARPGPDDVAPPPPPQHEQARWTPHVAVRPGPDDVAPMAQRFAPPLEERFTRPGGGRFDGYYEEDR